MGEVTVVALVLLGLLLAFGGHGDSPRDASRRHAGSAADRFGHIHGIGVDPGDETVYAGTHFGLFRLDRNGAPHQVSARTQDLMGFTVVGPGHFLASGHPVEGHGGPASLGLIESTDAGQTWKPVSLVGAADFHALESLPNRVYGLNTLTGQFLASIDGVEWEERSTLPMADFAGKPTNPDRLVAATENGPMISINGGRDFKPIEAAPLMSLVDWSADGTLVGLTPSGELFMSSTSTKGRGAAGSSLTWREVGDIGGQPEALEWVDENTGYAVTAGKVLVSRDGGATFTRFGG